MTEPPTNSGFVEFIYDVSVGYFFGEGTWRDSFYDEGGVGFVSVVWTFMDFEALGYRGCLDWDGGTDGRYDGECCTITWTEGIVGVSLELESK